MDEQAERQRFQEWFRAYRERTWFRLCTAAGDPPEPLPEFWKLGEQNALWIGWLARATVSASPDSGKP